MASTFRGNRLEEGIHSCGVQELQSVSPEKIEQLTSSALESRSSYYFSFVDGEMRKHHMRDSFEGTAKSMGEKVTVADMHDAITSAVKAQHIHCRSALEERKAWLYQIISAPGIESDKVFDARSVDPHDRLRAMSTIDYFARMFNEATLSPHLLFELLSQTGVEQTTTTSSLSAGVIGVLLSGEVSLTQMASIVAPALLSGCAIVIKVSHTNPQIGYIFSKIVEAARLPQGLISVVSGSGDLIGKALIDSDHIERVFYCGAINTARKIQSAVPWSLLQKIRFSTPFAEKAVAMVLKDCEMERVVRGMQEVLLHGMSSDMPTNMKQRTLAVRHAFVDSMRWNELCVQMHAALRNVQGTAQSVLAGGVHRCTAEMAEKQSHFLQEMMKIGCEVHSATISPTCELSIVFCHSPLPAKFSVDLPGPLLIFHKCMDEAQVMHCANHCMRDSLSWCQAVFSQRGLDVATYCGCHSTAVVLNGCSFDSTSQLLDHDIWNCFLKKKTVCAHSSYPL